MRILQVVNVRWHNATAWYALTLSKLLQYAGHEILTAVLPGTAPAAEAAKAGLPVVQLDANSLRPGRLAAGMAAMHKTIHTFRPDIVNCHRGEGFLLWSLMQAVSPGYALVRTRGDQRPPKNNLPNRLLHRRGADAVIASNNAIYNSFTQGMGLPEDHVHMIVGGVDTDAFHFDPAGRRRVRAEFGFNDDDCVVGLLGRFDRVKGHKELLQAAQQARAAGATSLKLLFIGFDTALSREDIDRWVRENDMDGHTRITGKRDDVAACISALDLGVVASLYSEAIARAALEIMACGRALIATQVGVMPDILSPEALAPPGDVPAMSALLHKACTEPANLQSLQTAQAKRLPDLTTEAFLHKTLAVYESALRRRGINKPDSD